MSNVQNDQAPSMFTNKGKAQLPLAIVIRIPLAVLKVICVGAKLIGKAAARGEKWCDKGLESMFKPEQNPAYNEYVEKRFREKAISQITRLSK